MGGGLEEFPDEDCKVTEQLAWLVLIVLGGATQWRLKTEYGTLIDVIDLIRTGERERLKMADNQLLLTL